MNGQSNAYPWRRGDAGVIVYFRLTPKSSKDAVYGLQVTAEGLAFQARVRAIPEDGAANAALEKLVSEWLRVPKRSVQLATGGKSRLKSVAISGDVEHLDGLLQAKLAELRT
ncbi:MAG: hypothetical protein HOP09_12170 [Hyphomicrobium sp.]|nr:hypothetical protein [Hyphomicrobium sp.]